MPDEQAPNTPRRSARLALLQERAAGAAAQVSPREEPPVADTTTAGQQQQKTDGEMIVVAQVVAMDMDNPPHVCCPSSSTRATCLHCDDGNGHDLLEMTDQRTTYYYEQLRRGPHCGEIRFFRPYRDLLSPRQINELVRALVTRSFTPHSVGYVYCFQHPGAKDVLDREVGPDDVLLTAAAVVRPLVKIGRTRNLARRMKQLRRHCGYAPDVRFAHRIPAHERVEALVHAQLYNARRKEHPGCVGCGARHDEWFDVGVAGAEDLVRLWQGFTTHSVRPYDAAGGLVPRWRERLQAADLDDAGCWAWFTHWDPVSLPAQAGSLDVSMAEAEG